MSAVKFVIHLDNNNNFARKDVTEIQNLIQNLILEPMLELLK